MVIAKSAFELFQRRYSWQNPVRSITVQAINLIPQKDPYQISLFIDAEKIDKMERIDKCIDEIRRRFGKDAIRNAILCQSIHVPPEHVAITMPTGMIG